ncbi:hypothetical protein PanWU01x14_241350 [Parasponia andersonii]|uniref:Uncharacterized protein n=1 Tax=Parasponia andersonii TaxID=3476 RepID=A0A2P5BGI7_PARAD|nr:hypothetical protein PanWU01x14_241350 [Parasponia andersonii]
MKVNHHNIFDVPEHEEVDGEDVITKVYQEEETNVLSPFHPTEEAHEPSSLARREIHPITLPDQLMVELNLSGKDINRSNNIEEADEDVDFYNDGHIFVNREDDFIVSNEESDDSDNESDDLSYDDNDVDS